MMSTITTLLVHDLAVAFKSKTLYLILCIPLLICATLALVDPANASNVRVKIGLLKGESYQPVVRDSIVCASDQFTVSWIANESEAKRLLEEREVDGILMNARGDASRLILTVSQQASVSTLDILQRLSALQAAVEGKGGGWISEVRSLQTSSVKRQTLPTWILMMVLIVGFIVLPAQVAEEKEKQLLLGWLQAPVRESEWLIAKLVYGTILMLISVAALQLMCGELYCSKGVSYLLMLCAGGFCFGAMGICLGLLCRNQASARTLGVLCYLPLLLPSALSDMSQDLRNVAPLVPSYHFYEPIRSMLLDGSSSGPFTYAWISLLVIGLLACLASHRLIKKRWLM